MDKLSFCTSGASNQQQKNVYNLYGVAVWELYRIVLILKPSVFIIALENIVCFNLEIKKILFLIKIFSLITDTLPPYLTSSTQDPTTISLNESSLKVNNVPVIDNSTNNSVPLDSRGAELTFKETGYEKQFMFAQNNTFIQIDGDTIQRFQLR